MPSKPNPRESAEAHWVATATQCVSSYVPQLPEAAIEAIAQDIFEHDPRHSPEEAVRRYFFGMTAEEASYEGIRQRFQKNGP